MNLKKDIAHRNNYGSARDLSKIQWLVIHYTGNDGDSAEGNARHFNSYRGVSAHYFVDDDSIVQTVPDEHEAWAVGGSKYPSCDKTGGGKYYNKCVNRNSISVELCDTVRNGKYGFTEKTLANAAELCRMLVDRYKIKPENIIRHFDVTGKNCPAPFVSDEKAWEEFKERIVGEMVEKGTVIVDGKEHEVSMIRKDGVTYIKTRDIANLVGYQIGNKGKTPVFAKK